MPGATAGEDTRGHILQSVGLDTDAQQLSVTDTAVNTSAFSDVTRLVRIAVLTDCYVRVGKGVTATASNGSLFPSGAIEYVNVNKGDRVSIIRHSADGDATVTECT